MSRHRRPKAGKPRRMRVKFQGFCPRLVSRRRATGAVLTVQVGAPVVLGVAALFTTQAPIPLSGMDLTSPPSLFAPAPSTALPGLTAPSGPGASLHGTFGFPQVLASGVGGQVVDVPNLLRVASISDTSVVRLGLSTTTPTYVGRHRYIGPPCHPVPPVVVVTPPVDTAPPPSDPPASEPSPTPDPPPAPAQTPPVPELPPVNVPVDLPPVDLPPAPDVVSDPVGTVTDTVKDTTAPVADTVKDTAGDVVGTVKDTVDSVVDASKDDSPPKDTSDSVKSDSGSSDTKPDDSSSTSSDDSSSDKSDSKSDSSDSKSDSSGSDSSSSDTHTSGDSSHDSN